MKKPNIQSVTQLLNTLDTAKAKLNPLPTSYMADKADTHLREIYATMLASFLLTRETISDNEQRLFSLLLNSLEVGKSTDYFLQRVNELTPKEAITFIEGLNSNDKRLNFIFEALLLARVNAPINEMQIQLFNQLLSFWDIENIRIHRACYWVSVVLGLTKDGKYPYQDKVTITKKSIDSDIKYLKFLVEDNTMIEDDTILFKGKVRQPRGDKDISPTIKGNGYLLQIYLDSEEKRVFYKYIHLPTYLKNWIPYLKQVLQHNEK